MDMKELFENNCFPMSWSSEAEDIPEQGRWMLPSSNK